MLKEIGLIGLGVMGKNIALNLSDITPLSDSCLLYTSDAADD